MQTQVKQLFQSFLKQEDQFAQELYKTLRKMAKKFEKFELAHSKGYKLTPDEEEKKITLKKQLTDYMDVFELYKKHHSNKENEDVPKIPVPSAKDKSLQSENKVVDCQILTDKVPVSTASKEIQSSNTHHHQHHEVPQPVKILVRDPAQVEEAMKVASQIYQLGSNIPQLQMSFQRGERQSPLTSEELFLVQKFFFDIAVGNPMKNLADKIEFSTQELFKVSQGSDDVKVTCHQKFSYGDLKKILETLMEE